EKSLEYIIKKRQAGAGSLGRQRFVALAAWRGGLIAREIKASLPSACTLVVSKRSGSFAEQLLKNPNRVPDPFAYVDERWIARRLAPDCAKIEMANIPLHRDEERLLHAMGFETANVHLADGRLRTRIRTDLDRRRGRWLHQCAKTMAMSILNDTKEWRRK